MNMHFDKSVVSPILIGREEELETLTRLISLASAGNGQIALISAEAGLGKSRLVTEVKSGAGNDFKILEGFCFHAESSQPYAPLMDLLRYYLLNHPAEEVERVLQPAAPQLVKLLPELLDYLPGLPTASATPNPDPKVEKQRTFLALVRSLAELTQPKPLMLIIEDLHWSDATSLEFLLTLARRASSLPICLILTYRTDESTPELTHFLAELDRNRLGVEISLQRMTQPDVDLMLRTILDLDSPISQEFLDLIVPLTEGNPFFIEEIVKTLMADGEIFYANGAWDRKDISQLHIPRTIQDAVQRRTQKLDEKVLHVLTVASVIGKRFNFHLLRKLLNTNDEELLGVLKQLVKAQLIVEESADQFVFRHSLTRQAVYATLLARERYPLHRSVGLTIEQLYASTIQTYYADLSYHYFTANEWGKALEYSIKAGDQAGELYAPRESIIFYSRVLVCARELTMGIETGILLARGRAYETLGDFRSALNDYEHALKLAREANDGRSEWQTLVALGSLWAERNYQKTGEYFQQAESLAQTLNNPKLHAQSLNRWGNWSVNIGRIEAGLHAHQRALKIYQDDQDSTGIADTHDLLGMATMQHGNLPASFEEYRQAIELFRTLDDKHGLITALIGSTHTFNWNETNPLPASSLTENQTHSLEALELTRQTGWTSGQAFIQWTFALHLSSRGLFAESIQRASEALRIATEINHRQWTVGAQYTLGHAHLLMLQAETAIHWLDLALAFADKLGSAWWVGNISADLALVHVLNKNPEQAKSALSAGQALKVDEDSLVWQRLMWAQGNYELLHGTPVKALKIADAFASQTKHASPHVLHLKAQALLAQKQANKALPVFEQAKASALQREALPLLWQIHAGLGWLHKDQKDAEQSEAEFAEARRVLDGLAVNIEEESLQAAFKAQAAEYLPKEKSRTKRQSEAEQFGGLTTREREVMRFLSQGKSNREIAESLVLSERTVENHVANILNKLSLDSRAQAAVWAVEKGLI